MSYNFTNRYNYEDLMNIALMSTGINLSPEQQDYLKKCRRGWNFYDGYHWEEIPQTGKPEVTLNYCRAFVNKLVAFEFGKGFGIKMKPNVEEKILPYLNDVWDTMNNRISLGLKLGQSKSITGDGWIQIKFIPKFINGQKNSSFHDPFDLFPNGKIDLTVVSSNTAFPEYDSYNKNVLKKFTLMYPIYRNEGMTNNKIKTEMYKMIWTNETVSIYRGKSLMGKYANDYGFIPFVHIKNIEIVGRDYGLSDLEDLIPLNMEFNLKKSDVSEIIDYHSAPVTVIYGATLGNLERGANKVWGGLPSNAKVENLKLEGDLLASVEYINSLKEAMHEVGSVPESSLGKEMNISNTSGVALEVTLMPLIEKIRMKKAQSKAGLSYLNKCIIKIGIDKGLIRDEKNNPISLEKLSNREIYYNEITFEDNLPKDLLIQLQALQLEMKMGLADREEGMKRLGKEDIVQRISEINKDRENYPEIYGIRTILDEEEIIAHIESLREKALNVSSLKKSKSKQKDVLKRPLNVNKEDKQAQVNAGYQNGPEAK